MAPAPTDFSPPLRGGRPPLVEASRLRVRLSGLLRLSAKLASVAVLALLVILAWDLWHLVPGLD